MARQKGHHKIIGTTGDLTYQKTRDGYTVKQKSEISADAIKNSEKYHRVRENMAEFARAGKACKLLRTALSKLLEIGADTRMTSRLTTAFLRIIKSDPVSDRGKRSLYLGELDRMAGFEFNQSKEVVGALKAPYSATIDRVSGLCTISIPGFVVKDGIAAAEGATHCRIMAGAASLNFDKQTYVSDIKFGVELALGDESAAAITLSPQVTAASPDPIFLVLGVQYFMSTNGKLYTINRAFNALGIVKLDFIAAP